MFKILKTIASIALVSLALAACGKVPAGNVGVKVYMLGGDKGVDSEELPPGRYWIGWNEELFLFPTFTQNDQWQKNGDRDQSISFQSKEGMNVNADIGISYSIIPDKATNVFQKYRRGVDEITDTALRNAVQNEFNNVASTKSIESVYGEGKVEMMQEVQKRITAQFLPIGIRVENIYYINRFRFDEVVTSSINAKIAATQKAQQRMNEVQQSRAEADKKIEEARGTAESILAVAKAQAEGNQILAKSLTSELVQYKLIEQWNGELPRISSSSNGLLFNLPMENLDSKKPEVTESDKTDN